MGFIADSESKKQNSYTNKISARAAIKNDRFIPKKVFNKKFIIKP